MPSSEEVKQNQAAEPKASAQGVALDAEEFVKYNKWLGEQFGPIPIQMWAVPLLFALLRRKVLKKQDLETAVAFVIDSIKRMAERKIIVPDMKAPQEIVKP